MDNAFAIVFPDQQSHFIGNRAPCIGMPEASAGQHWKWSVVRSKSRGAWKNRARPHRLRFLSCVPNRKKPVSGQEFNVEQSMPAMIRL